MPKQFIELEPALQGFYALAVIQAQYKCKLPHNHRFCGR